MVEKDKEKKARKELRERKVAIRTRSEWIKMAQVSFNAYIRKRDEGKDCICCPRSFPLSSIAFGGGFDCGHYRSIGSAPHLRFDERNAHGQKKQCNRYGLGRAVDYRLGLIQRIGLEEVERLESDQTPRKFTVDELKSIIADYKAKAKEIT
jgi:hypothetical protein